MTTEEKFRAAVNVIQSLPKDGSFQPSNEMKLKFYSHYKQATQGPCDQARPGFWDPIGRAKHDGWASLGHMTKEEAMQGYVNLLSQIVETMNFSADVGTFIEVLGPFYEYVEDKISPSKNSASQKRPDNRCGEPESGQLDNMVTTTTTAVAHTYLDSNSNNNMCRVPRTVSSQDVGSVVLDTRKTDMNHNCFTASTPKITEVLEEEDEDVDNDDIEDDLDDDDEVGELLGDLVAAAGQELTSASSLLKEIQRSLGEDGSGGLPLVLDHSMETENEEEEEEDSKTEETVINNNINTNNNNGGEGGTEERFPDSEDESDEEIFEDSVENTLEHQSTSSSSKLVTPASQLPPEEAGLRAPDGGGKKVTSSSSSGLVRRDGSVESYYLGDPRDIETSSLPQPPTVPSTTAAYRRSAAATSAASYPSTPLYPEEEELVVYSSGDSEPSRILMRPLEAAGRATAAGAGHRFSDALVRRLEGDVRLVNSNLTHLTSRLEMITSNLEHMTARLGSIESNFDQVHARINTIEYLMQVLLSREERGLVTKSSLATFSVIASCAALLFARVFASRRN